MPTANTEEGLRRRCEARGQAASWGRWSPCDWEYHCYGKDHFARVMELLERGWDEDFSSYRVDRSAVRAIARRALLRVRARPSGATVLLSIWLGDQSDEDRIAEVRRLNPPEVAEGFERQLRTGA